MTAEERGYTRPVEAAERLVVASCEAQGIQPKISDPVVLGKIAAALRSDAPVGRNALRVEAVEARPPRIDGDGLEDGREDRPLAA